MQFPFYIQIGHTKILCHAVFELLAFFIGFRYFIYLRKKQGDRISSMNRTWVLIGAIFGALIGSRLVGGLEDPVALAASKNMLLYFYQNKTILGGLLGGLFGVELMKKVIGEKTSSGDLFTYPLILAMIIGRIGCFSMGVYEETYGNPSSLPFAMNLGDGIARHPVCLYEIFFLVLLWIVLKRYQIKYQPANGTIFRIFMISYLLFRFFLDLIKPHYSFSIGLSTIQITCIAGLAWYAPHILKVRRTPDFVSKEEGGYHKT